MKVMIAMSGGVDSTVAAYLMKERGFDCVGATMKLFSGCDVSVSDAREAADRLDIPHYVFDLSGEFDRMVVRPFAEAYERGFTPNPCVLCNKNIKFEALFRKAAEFKCDYLVTGHYARLERDGVTGRVSLKKALDGAKDQSYFLCMVFPFLLKNAIFPLGGMTKQEVRNVAAAQGFGSAQKPESQDICFIAGDGYAEFIEQYMRKKQEPGDFINLEGKALGRHKGLIRYTIGQRKGLGIASERPLYVCAKDAASNTVTLGGEQMLYSATACAGPFNWMRGERPSEGFRAAAKIRYRQAEQWATVTEVATRAGRDYVRVKFDEPQRAVAPGQALVLYDGDEVIGGGIIHGQNL